MTALAAARNTRKMGDAPIADKFHIPVAAAKTIHQGGLVAVNTAGYAVPASASSSLKIVGVAAQTVDNSSGNAGDKTVNVERGTFRLANSATTDALTDADLFRDCYVVDDQTVARTSSSGTRPVAGRVVNVGSDGVWIETSPQAGNGAPIDIFLVAAADLSAKQYYAVKVDSNGKAAVAGAGEFACGVVQNAPAADAIAVVRVSGVTTMIAGANVVRGSFVASGAAGKSKEAVKATTNTSDAGGATDALAGSHVLGIALTTAGADTDPHQVLLTHSGAIPTTAA